MLINTSIDEGNAVQIIKPREFDSDFLIRIRDYHRTSETASAKNPDFETPFLALKAKKFMLQLLRKLAVQEASNAMLLVTD